MVLGHTRVRRFHCPQSELSSRLGSDGVPAWPWTLASVGLFSIGLMSGKLEVREVAGADWPQLPLLPR